MRNLLSFVLFSITAIGLLFTIMATEQHYASASNLLPQSGVLSGYAGQMLPIVPAVIPISTATSGVINLKGFTLVGIMFPSAFTGATISFTVSQDGTNFFALKTTTSGTSLTYTVTQGTYSAIDPLPFYGVQYLKIVSASTEGTARTLNLALKGLY